MTVRDIISKMQPIDGSVTLADSIDGEIYADRETPCALYIEKEFRLFLDCCVVSLNVGYEGDLIICI